MRTAALDIDLTQLADLVKTEYGLPIGTSHFLPKGEDAFIYLAEGQEGKCYFIRVQQAPSLTSALEGACSIHSHCGLEQIVTPLRTLAGAVTVPLHHYTVAVFPFIHGDSLLEAGAWGAQLAEAAETMARLHACKLVLPLGKEEFARPLAPAVACVLRQADSVQHQSALLLRASREGIITLPKRVDCLGAKLHALESQFALTHGDPNFDNWLISPDGGLHLTDWGDVAFGPPERDLFAFTGPEFREFLLAYVRAGGTRCLHIDAFRFYFERWRLQEIADYGMRLLIKPVGLEEMAHAWAEIQKYLPLRDDVIESELSRVRDAITAVTGC